MKIDGACHCGYITYKAELDPKNAGICHCTDCQTMSGSAFRTIAFTREGSFELLSGELKIYVKHRRVEMSGPSRSAPNAERRSTRRPSMPDPRCAACAPEPSGSVANSPLNSRSGPGQSRIGFQGLPRFRSKRNNDPRKTSAARS